MANEKLDVLYFRGSRPPRPEVIQGLEERECRIKISSQLEELLDALERRQFAVVITDASASESESLSRAADLGTTERLFGTPPFFFAHPAGKKALQALEKNFTSFIPYTGPIDKDSFLAEFDSALAGSSKSGSRPVVGKGGKRESVRLQMVKHLDPTRLVSSYGGAVFAAAGRASSFNDALLLPEHPKREELEGLLRSQEAISPSMAGHIRRVAYISSALANGTGCSKEDDQRIRTACFALNSGFTPGERSLIEADFLYEDFDQISDKVSDGILKSAESVRRDLNDEQTGKILELSALLVRNLPIEESRALSVSAQCVFLAELAGRSCWKDGIWSMLGAYRVIRELRSGETISVDQQLKTSLSRLISEACCVRHDLAEGSSSPKSRNDEEVQSERYLSEEAKKEAEQLFRGHESVLIELSDIRFGMRTASPVFTREGKLVLRAGVQFDDQIIWGLWQLVAVCPLLNPITVLK